MYFKDRDIEAFWEDPGSFRSKKVPPEIRKLLFRKLQLLNAAHDLRDLRIPPANKLEKLKGDRAGQYSIRVNDQYRLCFVWTEQGAEGVEFCDYHS
ncbi:type II toxin-antitoxin system RelE/ParE family toxin [Xiamenia xianingshaonis]|uniref:type II toxin-antitoxin system RelE/ParE family toxin n=1 Tax=Xiamenia xianingshaonis TaxID=2682776 RepID=UPI0021BD7FCC|nr:type II toxin-antitoxin system RelE/ParE family toxin [Xiamenia xianingshaonis]